MGKNKENCNCCDWLRKMSDRLMREGKHPMYKKPPEPPQFLLVSTIQIPYFWVEDGEVKLCSEPD